MLILVGTPIGNLGDISPRAVRALETADVVACEDTRRARVLLSAIGVGTGRRLLSVHDRNEAARIEPLLNRLGVGNTVALISDAGMPSVSDPGQRLVAAAIAAGHRVEVIPGPSAVLAALVVSGLATDRFCFEGFLPRSGKARAARLAALRDEARTTVVLESPARLAATVVDLVEALGRDRRAAVARELTKLHEQVWRGTLGEAVVQIPELDTRGELVIVLEGARPLPRESSDEDIERALSEQLLAGSDKRSAVARVATELGVPKRRAYEIAIDL